MIIIALSMIVTGVLLILRSSALSGRVLHPDDIFAEGGLGRIIRHVFAVQPFSGFEKDSRILVYGLIGLTSMICGIALFFYSLFWIYSVAGDR
ncbi:MAG TPA: hypothetical protein PLW09_08645 [Candidatus Kapabacteria bacterium]|jgi:hypothetical protein|nr:hypothetical protein [Candidatus Kapabacteria bacterium]HRK58649.1 hypothetical protein [Candidatus Kapabacteria bacterium]